MNSEVRIKNSTLVFYAVRTSCARPILSVLRPLRGLKNSRAGFGLIEILIVGAIIGVGFLAIISFLIFSRGVSFQIVRNTEATNLAEEAVEVVRKLRDSGWSTN